ncbi:hypothetical protein QAD02_010627 [Eretmocerus hayati]|uniref:Uncharacterized protein n=1 Tax=Eretmocerus hayati TaxID=131215 RepID=A0ACC2NUL1_9HYME|nr:hypothetical protein QAD02_010627 [Eretmocerus hayati]
MTSTMMLRSLRLTESLKIRFQKQLFELRRTFLSEAYQCQEAWDKRLESSLLKKVKPIDFFAELDQKFSTQKNVSAVDIDIFANAIQDKSHIEELTDLLYKLRMTRETTFTLNSTHHAVVRYCLKVGATKELFNILDDRLNFGIFCEYYDYNLLMDHFIKKEDHASAAKVATLMMLQEEFEHPLSNALAIYSCLKYLENPDSWQAVDPEVERMNNEPKEEVKVRVKYIINPWFDDHFDLWKPSDLVGKTLFWIGQTMDNTIGRSCHLRGLVLYRKYDNAIALLKKWKTDGLTKVVYKSILDAIKSDVPELFGTEVDELQKELVQLLDDLSKQDLHDGDMLKDVEGLINKAIQTHSQNDISKQLQLYKDWEEKRINVLKEHLAYLDRQARLAKVEEMKKDLVDRERLLTFFENEEQIELEIEKKLEKEKRLRGDVEASTIDNEDYIPPEIVRKRSN